MEEHDGHAGCADLPAAPSAAQAGLMTPEERMPACARAVHARAGREAIANLLARGVLRLSAVPSSETHRSTAQAGAIEAQRAQGAGAATSAPARARAEHARAGGPERAISEAAKEDGP